MYEKSPFKELILNSSPNVADGAAWVERTVRGAVTRGPGSPPVPAASTLGKGHTEHGREEVYGENVLKTQQVLIPRETNKQISCLQNTS